jgi:hypothetical protein
VPSFRYVLADVFTDTPLQGNGLAVFTDAREIPEESLQPLAREMNPSDALPRRSHALPTDRACRRPGPPSKRRRF